MSSSQSDYLQIERDAAELKRIKQALDALIEAYQQSNSIERPWLTGIIMDLMEVRNG